MIYWYRNRYLYAKQPTINALLCYPSLQGRVINLLIKSNNYAAQE
jgi:hypothetical protein